MEQNRYRSIASDTMGMRAARARGSKVGRPRAHLALSDLQAVRAGARTVASLARDKGVSVTDTR